MYRIGIDLGGTKLAVGLADPSGAILSEVVSHDHVGCDENGVLDRIVRNVDSALARQGVKKSEISGVGVLFPGHVRWPDGVTLTTSNLPGFKGFPFRASLQSRLGLPVVVDNDANGQTIGEFHHGAGKGSRNMVFLTVSTGVGGGIVFDGKLYRGATGTAGEFGHMIVDVDGPAVCTCGNRGCLMSIVSGLALRETYRRTMVRFEQEGKPALLPTGCTDLRELNGQQLSAGVLEGNEVCFSVTKEFGTFIGIGLYNIFQMLNPDRIVLGGGLLNLPEPFFGTALSTLFDKAGMMMYDRLDIRKGELGGNAGIVGAISLLEP